MDAVELESLSLCSVQREAVPFEHAWCTEPFDELAARFADGRSLRGDDAAIEHAAAAWMAVIGDRLDDAADLSYRAVALAGHSLRADVRVTVRALAMIVGVMRGTCGVDHELLDRLRDRLDTLDPTLGAIELLLEVPNWFTFVDRFDDAARMVDRRLCSLAITTDDRAAIWALTCRAELDLRRGRWTRAAGTLSDVLVRSQSHGLPAGYASVLAARLTAGRGDRAGTERLLAAARSDAYDRGDASTLWRVTAVDGYLALAEGDPELAVDVLAPLWVAEPDESPALASIRLWDGDLVEALVRVGDVDAAVRVADRLACELPTQWTMATQLRCAALTASDLGVGIELASRSETAFAALGAPFEQARSALVGGELSRRARSIREARSLLRRADAIFGALGAEPWQQRARRELRACGDGACAVEGLAELTEQEREMVLAAAAGASNREIAARSFVSVKTVETHLTRAYRKLGVRSRSQLAARLSAGAAS